MRLLTGIILPEEELLNKRMIGRGERRKAEAEEGPQPLEPEICWATWRNNKNCVFERGHKGKHSWEV